MIILAFTLKTAALVRGGKMQRHRDSKAGALSAPPVSVLLFGSKHCGFKFARTPALWERRWRRRVPDEIGGDWSYAQKYAAQAPRLSAWMEENLIE